MINTLQKKSGKLIDKINLSNEKYFILGFLIINLLIKLIFISSKDISHDEPFTIFHAQATWCELWLMLNSEPNPPLFYILLHFWVKTFGTSALSVRFLPVLFSSLAVIPLFRLSKLFGRNTLAIAVVAIYTFSRANMASAHDTRSYSLFALLVLLSTVELFDIIRTSNNKKGKFIVLSLYYFLMIYSHHIGFIVGVIHLVIILFNYRRIDKKTIFGLLLTGGCTFVLYSHYIPVFLNSFSQTTTSGTVNSKPSVEAIYGMIRYYMNVPVVAVLSLALFTVFTVKIFTLKNKRIEKSLLILFVGMYFSMYFLSDVVVLFVNRYVLFISSYYYLIIVLGIKFLTKNTITRISILLALIIPLIVTVDLKSDNKRYVHEIVDIIKNKETANTAIIICPTWTNHRFAYYYHRGIFQDYSNFDDRLLEQNIYSINSKEKLNEIDLDQFDKVIYLDGWAEVVDPELRILHALDSSYSKSYENYSFKGYRILTFDK